MINKFSFLSSNVEVKDTRDYGKGVFATAPIKMGSIVAVVGGHVLTINDENVLMDVDAVSDKWIEISEDFSIGPVKAEENDLMQHVYINHSCEPNCGFRGQIFIVAMRDISVGEEITFDYAMIIHSNPKSTGYFKMNCLCGTPSCRKVIDEEGWKLPELQKKYDGYFQWYLQEKINKLKNK